ncbi:MAG: MarR family winged helix-turn-helix transcriptional regulator [Ruegeria sp.]
MTTGTDEEDNAGEIFSFFNEIGIISQLSSTLLARSLPQGVHPSHFSIVNHLCRMGDGKTPVSIASAMQVTKNTMTHSLRVLENRGFIRVVPNPADARGKLVYLTDDGRGFREASIQNVADRFGHIFKPEHLNAMRRSKNELELIRKHLDENR